MKPFVRAASIVFGSCVVLLMLSGVALGATGNGERWYVRVSNVDDKAYIIVNDDPVPVAKVLTYQGDSGWVPITTQVQKTGLKTKIRFLLWNDRGWYKAKFEIGRQFTYGGKIQSIATTDLTTDMKDGTKDGKYLIEPLQPAWSKTLKYESDDRPSRWAYDSGTTNTLASFLGNNFGSPTDEWKSQRDIYYGYQSYGYYDWETEYHDDLYHAGVDISDANYYLDLDGSGSIRNDPALAVADGAVVYAQWAAGFGNTVIVKHTFKSCGTVYSQYSHLASIDVSKGDSVKKGARVGKIGNSGTKAYHLHFEIKRSSELGAGYTPEHPSSVTKSRQWRYFDPYYFLTTY